MRRVVLALLATTLGAVLLIGLKARGAPLDPALTASAGLDPASGDPGNSAPPSAAGLPGLAGSAGPSSSAPAGATASPGQPPTGSGPATTPPVARRTLTGTAVAAKNFGNMQVQIVVSGTHIDSISTTKQSNRPNGAATTLTPLALSAQAVPNVSCSTTVSGATYSCQAWLSSLQSAIGQI
jgi:uncharacterized protein with FMN-binding domain